jgi:hypothetical protein
VVEKPGRILEGVTESYWAYPTCYYHGDIVNAPANRVEISGFGYFPQDPLLNELGQVAVADEFRSYFSRSSR